MHRKEISSNRNARSCPRGGEKLGVKCVMRLVLSLSVMKAHVDDESISLGAASRSAVIGRPGVCMLDANGNSR